MSLLLLFAGASSGSAPAVIVADAGGSRFAGSVARSRFSAVDSGPFAGAVGGRGFAGAVERSAPFIPVRKPFRSV